MIKLSILIPTYNRCKRLKNSLGTGGTWSGQDMELQGDRRAEIMEWMRAMGFRPVLAGG